jgi:hypothetical protein
MAKNLHFRTLERVFAQLLKEVNKFMTMCTPERIRNQAMLTLAALFSKCRYPWEIKEHITLYYPLLTEAFKNNSKHSLNCSLELITALARTPNGFRSAQLDQFMSAGLKYVREYQ